MRAAKVLAVFAIAVLAIGAFSALALAGNKKKTRVLFFTSSPKFNHSGKVTAKGGLDSIPGCVKDRGLRLQLLDPAGAVIGILDGTTSDTGGNWNLTAQLPKGVQNGSSVRVKVTKSTPGKFVCRAGRSIAVPVPAT
jgi:hypothetical protein